MQLFLFLLGLLCSVLQAQHVSVTEKLTGFIGKEVILPCKFTSTDTSVRVSQIMWMHGTDSLAAYSAHIGTYLKNETRYQLLDKSETGATLKISPVLYTDEGEYVCEVTIFPSGNVKATTTVVIKVLQAQNVSVMEKLTGFIGKEVILPCKFTSTDTSVRVSQIMWMRGTDTLAAYGVHIGTYLKNETRYQLLDQSETSATLKISPVLYTDEGEYVCEVNTFPGGIVKATTTVVTKVLQGQHISVTEKLTGFIGKEVILPCKFTNTDAFVRVTHISWMRGTNTLAVYYPTMGVYIKNKTRHQLLDPSIADATLKISPAIYTDEGEYVCTAHAFPVRNSEATTTVIIKAIPQNSAKANRAVASDQEQAVATCKSANGRPPSQITWQAPIPGNISNIVLNNTDGTYTVVSRYLMTPEWTADGVSVTCIINYESADYPMPLKLSVQYSPVVTIEGYDDNWHLHRNGVYLTCNGKGNPPPTSYTWKTVDGSPLPASVRAKDKVLYVDEVDERVNRSFVCEVTNALGSRASRQDVLVRDMPKKI